MARDKYGSTKTGWAYEVVGTGPFPLDMLRYDGAFPARSEDVSRIEESLRGPRITEHQFVVRLRSNVHGPTEGRWQSFGWIVREAGLYLDEG